MGGDVVSELRRRTGFSDFIFLFISLLTPYGKVAFDELFLFGLVLSEVGCNDLHIFL